ncbi:hypothetical protein MJ904_20450 [Massilia sp. MB5]|uniref:hypothetical protein n=1 Tax=Massilia sp. MB5 TaxID=2919578 RepID=UPI001F105D1F|nr:hypothetical protein [Massilia sp. MB5]UMR29418.1 hypothetical protein MJ904_20450 [Massilia sp. MB5]
MDRHFPNPAELQQAFEDFGQGILYDEKPVAAGGPRRRPTDRLIHMMDGTPDNCIGYHRWHAFIRCAVASGADAARWLTINRFVALAWGIYSRLNPLVDVPGNPPLESAQMTSLRRDWLSADEATLNAAFLHYQGQFPDNYGSRRAREFNEIRYFHVQSILAKASGGSNPQHAGKHRFWELPMAAFLQTEVLGHNLIAPNGPGRGAASALTKVLRGTLSGFPRMPLNRPALNPADIAYIERWIDEI